MYVVWKIIPLEVIQKISEANPGSVSQISLGLFGKHFGYMPIFQTYDLACKTFPHNLVVQLPIEEVIIDQGKDSDINTGTDTGDDNE